MLETTDPDSIGPDVTGPEAAGPDMVAPDAAVARTFEVRLDNFTGPFDLLLGLIAKHEMDVTDVAIATVTDEFISYLKALQALGQEWALDEASEFLVLAATLLDLKAARLLPQGEVENDDDLALLEARDLLFARLLQYKAFKEVATLMGGDLEREARRFPRQVGLEPHFAALLPELVWRHTPQQFAELAAKAMETKEPPSREIGLAHLHMAPVSVRDQAALITAMLMAGESLSFATLTADAESNMVVIARFLALLELFRDQMVSFDQPNPLGELRVRWQPDTQLQEVAGSDFDDDEPADGGEPGQSDEPGQSGEPGQSDEPARSDEPVKGVDPDE